MIQIINQLGNRMVGCLNLEYFSDDSSINI